MISPGRLLCVSLFMFLYASAVEAQSISSGNPPNAALNTPYSFTFTATGGGCSAGPTYSWSATGLPPGLSLDSSSGVLSGTPSAAGPYANVIITVSVNGCETQVNSQGYNINVAPNQETFYVLNPNFGDSSALSITAINGGTSINCPAVQMTDPCYSYFANEAYFDDFTADGQGNFIVPAGSAVLKFASGTSTPIVVAQTSNPGLGESSEFANFNSAAVDSAGNFIVADNGNQAIWLFPADGSNATLVGYYPEDEGGEDVFVRIPPGSTGQYVLVDDNGQQTQFYQFQACQPMPVSCPDTQTPTGFLAEPISAYVLGFTFDAAGNYVTTLVTELSNEVNYVTITNATSGNVQTLFSNQNVLSFALGIFYDSQTGNYLVANEQLDPSGIYYLSSGPLSGNGPGAALIYSGPLLVNPVSVLTLPPQNVLPPPPPVIPPLVISGGPLPGGFAFEPYSSGVTASGGIPPYDFTGSGFPAGIAINQYTGAITGTTKTTGSFPLSITLTDSRGVSTGASLTLTIATPPPVTVSGGALPAATVQTPLSLVLSASGGAPPYTWTLAAGSLPPGLTLQPYGTVVGAPQVTGPFFFTARATDTAGGTAVGTFSIAIQPPALVPTTSSPLPSGMVSVNYPGFSFTLNGGDLPYTFNVTGGTFPPGLTLSPDGLITGIPTSAGNYTFTVNQTDSSSDPSTAYSMTIRPFSPDLILSEGSAAFTLLTPTSTLPPAQTVQVQSSEVTQTLGYSVSVAPSTATWLSAATPGSNTSGATTPGSFAIALTNAALMLSPSGTPYTATVMVTCTSGSCTGSQQTIAVTLTVTNAPAQLSVLTPLLSFNTLTSAPQTTTELLPVSNTGGGAIGFASITCGAPWCTVSGVPATISAGVTAALSVTANPAGLSAGYYYTDLSIVSSAGNAKVPVSLLIAANGTIALSPAGVEFNLPQGGQAEGSTSFQVSISGTQAVAFTAAVSPAVPWLTVTQSSATASGTQPATVNLVFNQSQVAALTAGPYYATVVITSSSNAANSPQSFEVVLNVTPPTQQTTPNPVPGGLIFLTQAGAATAPPQTVSIYTGSVTSVTYQASAATTGGGNWLSVSPTFGTTSAGSVAQGTITANPSGLKTGVYTGTVSYQFSATAVRSVNVTLVVSNVTSTPAATSGLRPDAASACTASQIVPTSTALVSNFAAPAAWPIEIAINLSDDCGSPINNGRVVTTFSNGDPPLILSLTDATGDYVATWAPQHATNQITVNAFANAQALPSATLQLPGAVTANNAPLLANSSIANFYNPVGGAPLAPGTLVQITGQYLAAQTLTDSQIPLPTSLGGTSVLIGGIQAPITSVSPNQINAQVPFELPAGQPYQVIVDANNALTAPQSVQAGAASPGLSVLSTGYVQASHQNGTPITEMSPAMPGEYIAVYLVGMGGTTIPVASGQPGPGSPFADTTIAPAVMLNNENAPVVFSGLIPGLVGVYQVNLQVPADASNGDLIFALSQDGFTSNAGVLPVHN